MRSDYFTTNRSDLLKYKCVASLDSQKNASIVVINDPFRGSVLNELLHEPKPPQHNDSKFEIALKGNHCKGASSGRLRWLKNENLRSEKITLAFFLF